MKKYMRVLLASVATFLALSISSPLVLAASSASGGADCSGKTIQDQLQCGANNTAGTNQSPKEAGKNLESTITNVINILSIFVGIAAVIMIIIGGFRYITSGGNQESTKSAKNTIIYAVIGLIIVSLAQVLVHFVLSKVSGK